MAKFMIFLSTKLDWLVASMGKMVAWLALVLVMVMFGIVVLRYGFDLGWIAMQESTLYFHAMIFLTAIGFTLQQEAHVRVDILYHKFSRKTQAWVDLGGTLFLLLPVSAFIFWVSLDYVQVSFDMREQSQEAGGLPWVYWLKSMIYLMAGLLLIQAVSNVIKMTAYLLGYIPHYKVITEKSEKSEVSHG